MPSKQPSPPAGQDLVEQGVCDPSVLSRHRMLGLGPPVSMSQVHPSGQVGQQPNSPHTPLQHSSSLLQGPEPAKRPHLPAFGVPAGQQVAGSSQVTGSVPTQTPFWQV